jgi:hypothetical protein
MGGPIPFSIVPRPGTLGWSRFSPRKNAEACAKGWGHPSDQAHPVDRRCSSKPAEAHPECCGG